MSRTPFATTLGLMTATAALLAGGAAHAASAATHAAEGTRHPESHLVTSGAPPANHPTEKDRARIGGDLKGPKPVTLRSEPTAAAADRGATTARASRSAGSVKAADADVIGVLVLMPPRQAASDQLGNGCWARFYDHTNFRGESLTLVGPVDMPRMDVPGSAWREWDSVMVGPKARVTAYDNENYNDRSAVLQPGQRIGDLGEKTLGWFEEIHSARVSCTS